jgi:oligopeptide transport system substrate-binding protein
MAESKTMEDPQPNYTAAEQLLAADMPIIPIYHYSASRMLKADIRGYASHNVFGNWYLKDIYRAAK